MNGRSIHNFEKRVSQAQKSIEASSISKTNKQLISYFIDECYKSGIGAARISKCIITMKLIAQSMNKDLDKVTPKDITNYLVVNEKKDYAEWTKQSYKVMIKKFYRWLGKYKNNKHFIEMVEDIKTTVPKTKQKLPSDLLTEEDILKLINSVYTFRDKALISLLYETGARVDEIGSMQIRDLTFDADGGVVILSGKTGMRRVRIVSSEIILKHYLEERTGNKTQESPLWTKENGEQITYAAITKVIKSAVDRAGMQKHVHPHLFRHSRATFLANRLTEAQMNNYLGWTQGSNMAKTYVHLSGRDVDDAILSMYGKKQKQEVNKTIMIPIKCKRCTEINPAGASFCLKCGAPLSVESMLEMDNGRKVGDDIIAKLWADEDVKKLIAQKINLINTKN